jgi:hypothetical protein
MAFELLLEDIQIKARLRKAPGDRVVLTLEYPNCDEYRILIQTCLADLLKPSPKLVAMAEERRLKALTESTDATPTTEGHDAHESLSSNNT